MFSPSTCIYALSISATKLEKVTKTFFFNIKFLHFLEFLLGDARTCSKKLPEPYAFSSFECSIRARLPGMDFCKKAYKLLPMRQCEKDCK